MSEPKYWSILIDVVVMNPEGKRCRGLLSVGFSWRGVFRWPKLTRFDHGFDAVIGGWWIGLEKPFGTAHS